MRWNEYVAWILLGAATLTIPFNIWLAVRATRRRP